MSRPAPGARATGRPKWHSFYDRTRLEPGLVLGFGTVTVEELAEGVNL